MFAGLWVSLVSKSGVQLLIGTTEDEIAMAFKEEATTISIVIRNVIGREDRIVISLHALLGELREAIQERTGVACLRQRLVVGEIELAGDFLLLSDFGLGDESVVVLARTINR